VKRAFGVIEGRVDALSGAMATEAPSKLVFLFGTFAVGEYPEKVKVSIQREAPEGLLVEFKLIYRIGNSSESLKIRGISHRLQKFVLIDVGDGDLCLDILRDIHQPQDIGV
jgi:hypothetical protein